MGQNIAWITDERDRVPLLREANCVNEQTGPMGTINSAVWGERGGGREGGGGGFDGADETKALSRETLTSLSEARIKATL